MIRPELITFDIFGTVLDWQRGLEASCRIAGRGLRRGDFDRIVDAQAELERGPFLDYATITRRSLIDVIGLDAGKAAAIGRAVGTWPLFEDAGVLRSLMRIAPCAAMTNSDRSHGRDIQERLGFGLDCWLCAEEALVYKPDPSFWQQMGRLRGLPPGPAWWHVSAYADYDLDVANRLGLTTLFVRRPHSRAGNATYVLKNLTELPKLLAS